MITIWRVFKSGFRSLFRHAWLSAAATAIMVVTLVVVSFSIFSGVFLKRSVEAIKDKIDITIYIKDGANIEQIKELQNELLSNSDVKSVKYQSKEEVLAEFETSSDPSKRQLAASAKLSGAGFSATLLVKANNLDNTQDIEDLIRQQKFSEVVEKSSVDSGNSRKENIEKLGKVSNAASRVGFIVSITFLIVALLIIFNTIRMAIFTRREEIEIMKLVGATKWFVRGPFIIEGALYGIIGASIAIAIIFPVLSVTKPFFNKALESDEIVRLVTDHAALVIAMEYAGGILIGAISSWLAISRHLKL